MPFIIHRLDLSPPQGQQSIAKDVPFRVTARWFLNVARVRLVSSCSESLANLLTLLASYKYTHFIFLRMAPAALPMQGLCDPPGSLLLICGHAGKALRHLVKFQPGISHAALFVFGQAAEIGVTVS